MSLLAPFLVCFVGFGFGATFSLGKLWALALAGLWLALGDCYWREGDWRLLTYLAVITLTTCLSLDPWTSIWGLYGTYQCGLLAALVLVPFWACVDSRHRAGLILGLRWGAVLMSAYGLLQLTGIWPAFFLPYPLFGTHRIYSTVGSPVYLGAVIALCWPFCETWLERLFLGACLVATGSRGAWLACAMASVYQAWPLISRWVRIVGLLATGLGLVTAFKLRPLSDFGRLIVWQAAGKGFLTHPITGWGPGNFYTIAEVFRTPAWDLAYGAGTQDYAHNLFLEAAATSGLLGLVGLALLIWALWSASQDRKSKAALMGFGIVGMLNPLPLIAKALALSIAASGTTATGLSRKSSRLFRIVACNILFAVMFLIYLDRMMTRHGQYAWAFSSEKAAYLAGVIRYIHPRTPFKL